MTTLSSHILDSVSGTHASGILVECFSSKKVGDDTWQRRQLFSEVADADGRIRVSVDVEDRDEQVELVFHSKRYFEKHVLPDDGYQIMETVVARLDLPRSVDTVHIPLVLSPHSCTFWWSGDPPA